jgi:hypothetical protein
MPDFRDVVQIFWTRTVGPANKAWILHIKLARLAKTLKQWHRARMKLMRKESEEAQTLVLQLDREEEHRQLEEVEIQSRRRAKDIILALVGVRKLRLRQRSRLTWIRAGMQTRSCSTYTPTPRDGKITSQFYMEMTGCTPGTKRRLRRCTTSMPRCLPPPQRPCMLNWDTVQPQRHDPTSPRCSDHGRGGGGSGEANTTGEIPGPRRLHCLLQVLLAHH